MTGLRERGFRFVQLSELMGAGVRAMSPARARPPRRHARVRRVWPALPRSAAPRGRAGGAWIVGIEPWRGLGYRAPALARYLGRMAAGRQRLARRVGSATIPSGIVVATDGFLLGGFIALLGVRPDGGGQGVGPAWSPTSPAAPSPSGAGSSSRATLATPARCVSTAGWGSPGWGGFPISSRAGRVELLLRKGAPATRRVDGRARNIGRCADAGRVPWAALMIGEQFGNYRAIALLGEGGMGAVYLAEHPAIGRRVAVKVLHKNYTRDENLLGRFLNEARAANAIRHPNIIEILDSGVMARRHAVSGDGAAGGREPGDAAPRQRARWRSRRALDFAYQTASALGAAHKKGIVHRDLKPDNLFLVARSHTTPSASGSRCSTSASPSCSRGRAAPTRSRPAPAR